MRLSSPVVVTSVVCSLVGILTVLHLRTAILHAPLVFLGVASVAELDEIIVHENAVHCLTRNQDELWFKIQAEAYAVAADTARHLLTDSSASKWAPNPIPQPVEQRTLSLFTLSLAADVSADDSPEGFLLMDFSEKLAVPDLVPADPKDLVQPIMNDQMPATTKATTTTTTATTTTTTTATTTTATTTTTTAAKTTTAARTTTAVKTTTAAKTTTTVKTTTAAKTTTTSALKPTTATSASVTSVTTTTRNTTPAATTSKISHTPSHEAKAVLRNLQVMKTIPEQEIVNEFLRLAAPMHESIARLDSFRSIVFRDNITNDSDGTSDHPWGAAIDWEMKTGTNALDWSKGATVKHVIHFSRCNDLSLPARFVISNRVMSSYQQKSTVGCVAFLPEFFEKTEDSPTYVSLLNAIATNLYWNSNFTTMPSSQQPYAIIATGELCKRRFGGYHGPHANLSSSIGIDKFPLNQLSCDREVASELLSKLENFDDRENEVPYVDLCDINRLGLDVALMFQSGAIFFD